MEEETSMVNITINRNKSIGDVVFVLEGSKDEFRLFTNVFEKIFSITTIKCRSKKTCLREYVLPNNRDSIIYLINSSNSSIRSLGDQQYIKDIFGKINAYFKIDISNSAIYFIWDRDKASNNVENVKKYLNKYHNSRDNGYEMQGILLLSYPSLESFMISCFEDKQIDKQIINIKSYLTKNKYNYNQLDEGKIINAAQVFLERYQHILNENFSPEVMDTDMSNKSIKIFEYEEDFFSREGYYYYFSCIIISLFDLGLLKLDD